MPRRIDHRMIGDDHQHQQRDRGHQHRGLDAVAHPGDRHIARTVGDPGDAGGDQRDRNEEGDDADHRALIAAPSARAVFAAYCDAAAIAAARALAFSIQAAAGARALSGSLARSASARGDIGIGGVDLDAREHRRRIVALRRVHRTACAPAFRHWPEAWRGNPPTAAAHRRFFAAAGSARSIRAPGPSRSARRSRRTARATPAPCRRRRAV